jgi:hypothetical protein
MFPAEDIPSASKATALTHDLLLSVGTSILVCSAAARSGGEVE